MYVFIMGQPVNMYVKYSIKTVYKLSCTQHAHYFGGDTPSCLETN